jgi:hypothetical protein
MRGFSRGGWVKVHVLDSTIVRGRTRFEEQSTQGSTPVDISNDAVPPLRVYKLVACRPLLAPSRVGTGLGAGSFAWEDVYGAYGAYVFGSAEAGCPVNHMLLLCGTHSSPRHT